MKVNVYKHVELSGTSASSIEDAVGRAIKRAHRTAKGLRWFQAIETRGSTDKVKVQQWQMTIKVGFAVEN
jgi:flavin-binding protein dodecin